jgi:flagella basal body P-ring formation protein FlgA
MKPFAILLSFLTGCGLGLALAAVHPATSPVAQAKLKVVVAKVDIAMGTTIRDPKALFALCEHPWWAIPADAFTNLYDVTNLVLKVNMRPGQILTQDHILHDRDL